MKNKFRVDVYGWDTLSAKEKAVFQQQFKDSGIIQTHVDVQAVIYARSPNYLPNTLTRPTDWPYIVVLPVHRDEALSQFTRFGVTISEKRAVEQARLIIEEADVLRQWWRNRK